MSTLTSFQPVRALPKSPVGHIHKLWFDSKLYKKVNFDSEAATTLLADFLIALSTESCCADMYKLPHGKVKCSCMRDYVDTSNDEKEEAQHLGNQRGDRGALDAIVL